MVPLALVLVGKLFPYEQRGRPLGWLFGAMAGGMAFGAPLGRCWCASSVGVDSSWWLERPEEWC